MVIQCYEFQNLKYFWMEKKLYSLTTFSHWMEIPFSVTFYLIICFFVYSGNFDLKFPSWNSEFDIIYYRPKSKSAKQIC